MEPTSNSGKQHVEHSDISGSTFKDVNMKGSDYEDINLSNTRFHNVNFSEIIVTAAQIGGAFFKHIGPPPDKNGIPQRQRPVRFEEASLCDSIFKKVDLSNVKLEECILDGMTIDGILVTDLLEVYKKVKAE